MARTLTPRDFAAVREGLAAAVPFNSTLALEYVELQAGRAVVRLPDAPGLRNHLGTQHAGGLFSAAEAASGAAFVAAFVDHIAALRPAVRRAVIEYRRPARGAIDATAIMAGPRASVLADLDTTGSADFEIAVELADGAGTTIAVATFDWNLRRPR